MGEPLESEAERDVADAFARHWTDRPAEFVRRFSNPVYRLAPEPGRPALYLRLTPETHRSASQVESELAVIRHLAAEGVPVGEPVSSRLGAFIHTATLGGTNWSACAFEEAPGTSYAEAPPPDEPAFFRHAGRALGRLHRALSTFVPSPGFTRFHWTEDRWSRFSRHVPEAEAEAWDLYRELLAWTGGLSAEAPSFGLIHGDFTIANVRILDDRITAFDFDSCCEHWRAYELAVFLHYFGGRDQLGRAMVWDRVLTGYSDEYVLPAVTVDAIPRFGLMRLLFSFLVFAEAWGFEDLTPEQEAYFQLRRDLFRQGPVWPGAKRP